ncbi:MAG TPA: Gfo/Idh/MocA family oxidoreductase [Candidatus Saccharimonadales bacterium]|nr:Gfo/Idh/MocA family oxidoreductase [Candidatus Saccharimonadales bacterium]
MTSQLESGATSARDRPGLDPPTQRVRLGILGLGAVAQAVHLPLIERLRDHFEIAAIADLSATLTMALGDRYQVAPDARHGSLEGLLTTPGLDALVILTTGSHGRAVLAGLDRGLAVFAEKPLAYTQAETTAIAERLDADPGRKLQVGYMKLSDPAVVHARAVAADRSYGPPRAVEVTVLHPTSESQLAHARLLPPASDVDESVRTALGAETEALRRSALGDAVAERLGRLYSDILLGSIVHELALTRAFAGDPTAIDAVATWPDGSWPGSVELTGQLPNDGRVSIRWHFLPDYPAYREEVRVVYAGATSELSFPSPYLLHHPTELRLTATDDRGRRDEVWTSPVEAFEQELLAFHAYVVEGTQPPAGLAEGLADIITCQRAIAAMATAGGLPIGGEAAW